MNQWQDWVLAACLLAFNVALLPSVIGRHKPKLATSLMTGLFVLPEIIVFLSLSLWYSFIMSATNAALWLTLAMQRYLQMRKG